jgi:acetyl esterase/lipase
MNNNVNNTTMIKKAFFTILSFAVMTAMYGQTGQINLWQDDAPFNKKGVTVAEVNKESRISKVTVPQLYHFPANASDGSLKPAIVIVPGGGYAREAFDHEGVWVARWFNQHGYEAFVLKYRLPDRSLVDSAAYVPLMDAQQAIYLVRSRAGEWGLDTARIGIIGFSAGGHLASCVSTLFKTPVNKDLKPADVRPSFSILMYPVISMEKGLVHQGSKDNLLGINPKPELVEYFSTHKQVSAQTPVTLLVHAIDDKAVPSQNSDYYCKALYKAGVQGTKVILPTGGHGFGFDPQRPIAYWTSYLETWLKVNVK